MTVRIKRALLWALTLTLMAVIFGFSSQGAEDTMATSGAFAEPLARLLAPLFPHLDAETLLNAVQLVVRKLGHFAEYAALGCSLRWLLGAYPVSRAPRWAWLLGTLYAATDELHQFLGSERTGMWQDVLLDSIGVLAGIGAAVLLTALWHKLKSKKAA